MKVKKPKIDSGLSKNIESDYLSFSWKYFERTQKFHLNRVKHTYVGQLIEKLHELSKKTEQELFQDHNLKRFFRLHPIDWKDTTENGFSNLPEKLLEQQPWQFSVTSNEHGRVHGFFIDSTFYIVWFDPDHLLYSND